MHPLPESKNLPLFTPIGPRGRALLLSVLFILILIITAFVPLTINSQQKSVGGKVEAPPTPVKASRKLKLVKPGPPLAFRAASLPGNSNSLNPYSVLGPSVLSASNLVNLVTSSSTKPYAGTVPLTVLATLYINEGALAGVRGDVAFCQAIVETGWFSYQSSSLFPANNNFSGLGAYSTNPDIVNLPTAQLGVRSHIQHLRNFADPTSNSRNIGAPLVIRPGYNAQDFDTFFKKGSAPYWESLNGSWAVPGTDYYQTIFSIYNKARTSNGFSPVT